MTRSFWHPVPGQSCPNIPGIHARNIFAVKTVPDSDAIKTFLASHPSQQALVIGGGFIGLETAEALMGLGLTVTIVEKAPQILPPFDQDMATLVAHHLQERGVNIIAGDGINGFRQDGDLAKEAELESGKQLPMDLAILSIGVRPELKLAREAGLEIGSAGGIAVNTRQHLGPRYLCSG